MDSPLQPPVMLDDLKRNLQKLSANLPPDSWELEPPKFYLQRQGSGLLEVQQLDGADAVSQVEARTSPDRSRSQIETSRLLGPAVTERGISGERSEPASSRREVLKRLTPRKTGQPSSQTGSTNRQVPESKSCYQRVKGRLLRLWPFCNRKVKKSRDKAKAPLV